MYSVRKIYIEQHRQMQIYEPADLSLKEMIAQVSLNTKMWLGVLNLDTEKYTALDFYKLITELTVDPDASWEDFDRSLTDKIIIGFESHLPGFIVGTERPSHPVKFWDVMGGYKLFEVGYGNHLSGESNIAAVKWLLEDIKISILPKAENYPDLSQCLPIVNGITCKPYYLNGVLYGLDGSTYCYHGGKHYTPEVQLLDFSELGGFEISSLVGSVGGDKRKTVTKIQSDKNTVQFTSPYSLYEKVPLLVLGGMLIFPDQLTIHNEFTFSIALDKTMIHKCFAYQKYLQNNYLDNSDVVVTSRAFLSSFIEHLAHGNTGDCFVAYINSPRLFVVRHKLTAWRHGISIDSVYHEGLLINDTIGSVVNFHLDRYTHKNELTVQYREPIYLIDRDRTSDQKIFLGVDCEHIPVNDLHRGSYTLVLLSGDVK